MAKVKFKRFISDSAVENAEIEDGSFIVSKSGTSYVDFGNERIAFGGTSDTQMSDTSVNSVQNKVVKSYVDDVKEDVQTAQTDISNLQGTILYSNSTGTTGTVSLSDTYTNYRYIEVFGKKDNIVSSTKFDTTLNSKASLTISNRNNSTTITIYTNTSTFSGTSATVVGGAVAFNSGGVVGFTGSNEIYIIKVIGYN